jgi:hypothetical protein
VPLADAGAVQRGLVRLGRGKVTIIDPARLDHERGD